MDFDGQNLHYSWDWDQVHFVHLNLFAGTQKAGVEQKWDPYKSLDFLKADLEKQVGGTGIVGEVAELVNLCAATHKSTHVESSVMWSTPGN